MEKVILEAIGKYNLFDRDAVLVLAVSGGADSMMLLHVLHRLGYQLVIAHVNHQKREDAWRDQQLVEETARQLAIPCHVFHLPPSETAENFQAYARRRRYEFFEAVAECYQTSYILTAHHGDDHLETVIQRLLHHQSASGLQGIRPKSSYGKFILARPLLGLGKADIYCYCQQEAILYREDSSNQSDAYTRNRIRRHIVPALQQESPRLRAHLRMLSDGLAEDEAYFEAETDRLWQSVQASEDAISMSRSWVKQLPPALSKRLLKRALETLGVSNFTADHLAEALQRIAKDVPNDLYPLSGGACLLLAYDQLQFLTNYPNPEPYDFILSPDAEVTLPNQGVLVINYKKEQGNKVKSCINEVHLCYNEIELPLRVRTRKNGDRMSLKGGGTKKIKEIMIEAKIPKHLRDSWPVVTDSRDRIIWLPLLKKGTVCREAPTGDMITLQYRHLGGN